MMYLVIGSGSIGRRHFANLISLGAEAELISWRDEGNVGVTNRIVSLRKNVAVVICTATSIRRDIIDVCAANNVPMYIEKPLAYRSPDLDHIYETVHPDLQKRCLIGFMMRYHPIHAYIRSLGLENILRMILQVGHDVTKWRQGWDFESSYAADSDGGGVLLDLCHEIDIACTYMPEPRVMNAISIGHPAIKGVDILSCLNIGDAEGRFAHIEMDYLAPSLVRNGTIVSLNCLVEYDLVEGTVKTSSRDQVKIKKFRVDRNEMFLQIMADFIGLASCNEMVVSEHVPRMNVVKSTAYLIADAWQRRDFVGVIARGAFP